MTCSHGSASLGTRVMSSALSARPPDFSFSLWQLMQYFCTTAWLAVTASAAGAAGCAGAFACLAAATRGVCADAGACCALLPTLATTAITKQVAVPNTKRFIARAPLVVVCLPERRSSRGPGTESPWLQACAGARQRAG